MKPLEEVILGEELGDELLALEILQLAIGVGHARAQKRALQTTVATPLLAIWQNEGPVALADALADHREGGSRAIDTAALLEKVAGSLLGAQVDDGAQAVLHAENGAVLLVQFGMSEPWVALGHLKKITNERKTGWPRWQALAEGIVAVRDDDECQ